MRACGYCRNIGHTANKCEYRHGQIESIRRHFGGERRALHQLLLDNGIGLGAILRQNYYSETTNDYVITSLRDSLEAGLFEGLVDYRLHKYRKSVRSTLRSYTGTNHTGRDPDGYFVAFGNVDRVYIQCRQLDNMSVQTHLCFYISQLEKRPDWTEKYKNNFYVHKIPTILAPSSDSDIREDDFNAKFRVHERLWGSEEIRTYTPIVP